MPAFGSQPGDFGDAGVEIPPPPENQFEQMVEDIHRIEQKYVEGHTNYRQVLQLAANAAMRLDMTGQRVNSIILTAATGVLFGYLFDITIGSGATAFLPDFAISAGVVPGTVQVMVPERDDYVLSVQEGAGSTATGVIRAMKI